MNFFNKIISKHFNKKALKTMKAVLPMLPLHQGQAIADIGCGGGAYTLEFATQVGDHGQVYAVDVNSARLAFIRRRALKLHLNHRITLVLAEEDDTLLPESQIDLAFLRNSYHHIKHPAHYFNNLRTTLKPTGQLVIIDYDHHSRTSPRGHAVAPETIKDTLVEAGFRCTARFDHLPGQSFQLFTPLTTKQELSVHHQLSGVSLRHAPHISAD